jgi:hypothetical protein
MDLVEKLKEAYMERQFIENRFNECDQDMVDYWVLQMKALDAAIGSMKLAIERGENSLG